MAFSWSVSIIIPAAALPSFAALGPALGFTADEFSVGLSPTGQEPATHYGLHTWSRPEFVHTVTEAETVGSLDAAQTAALRAILTVVAVEHGDPQETFATAMQAAGVQKIEPEIIA